MEVVQTDHYILEQLEHGALTDEISAIVFLWNKYKAIVVLFCKGRSQEGLPPTTDAARLHIKRAHYHAMDPTPQHSSRTSRYIPDGVETGI